MGRSTTEAGRHRVAANTETELLLAAPPIPQHPDDSRIVVLHGDVTEQSISVIIAQLMYLANLNNRPISLIVSTYGGSVDEMFALYDTIKFLKCPVHTIALGKVMSAGVLLLASGTKGCRHIGKSSRIMIHSLSGSSSGNVFELVNESKETQRLHDMMVKALVKETKMTKDQVNKVMSAGHDFYLSAELAVRYGIVDKIIGS